MKKNLGFILSGDNIKLREIIEELHIMADIRDCKIIFYRFSDKDFILSEKE